MGEFLTAENIAALVSLTSLEIVLGIDNVVFIAILTGKLPRNKQALARRVGLGFAMIARVLLLLALSWIMRLTAPLFEVFAHPISGRDLILFTGGLFLIGKATFEIHDKLEGDQVGELREKASAKFWPIIFQVALLDIVFSLDSVITAIGMAQEIWVMIVAVMLAVCVMLVFAGSISEFIMKHPTLKMLALSFLLLIGVMLVAESLGKHIEKGYIYFAMAFSLLVEILNLKVIKLYHRKST